MFIVIFGRNSLRWANFFDGLIELERRKYNALEFRVWPIRVKKDELRNRTLSVTQSQHTQHLERRPITALTHTFTHTSSHLHAAYHTPKPVFIPMKASPSNHSHDGVQNRKKKRSFLGCIAQTWICIDCAQKNCLFQCGSPIPTTGT